MKIAVISPNPHHLAGIGQLLEARAHAVLLFEGGKTRMQEIADSEQPDMMLVDGICCDTGELSHVEHVTTHHPGITVVLMCSAHTSDFLINAMRAGVREVLPSPVTKEALVGAVDARRAEDGIGDREARARQDSRLHSHARVAVVPLSSRPTLGSSSHPRTAECC